MEIRIEKFNKDLAGLAWAFQVNPDSCGNPLHYENYIRLIALSDKAAGNGLTYVVLDEDDSNKKICGFITLRTSSVIKQYEDRTEGEAALEITELAVDRNYERQGIGKLLLSLAVNIASEINAQFASVKCISLCADPYAVPFYERFGFSKLEDYGDVPREGWNTDCIPMVLRFPEG